MQGLIKDLIDITIGGNNNNNEEEEDNRGERSRSTWAQVVSGDDDVDDRRKTQYSDQHNYNSKGEEYGRNEGWETSGRRHPQRRHEKVVSGDDDGDDRRKTQYSDSHNYNSKGEEGGRNEGWETAGHRHPQRRHEKVSMDHWNGYKRPLSEQEYSNEFDFGTDMEPSEDELADLSRACNRLWELDVNRLVPGKDYEIDCAEGKKAYQKEDVAQGSLFSWLSDDVFRRPTYSRFCSLLDNYNPNQGSKENVTSQETQEQAAFIEEISRTAPIKYLHKYLACKGIAPQRYEDFKRMMTDLWFELYGRGGSSSSSSAFEHVFVGEIKQRGEHEVSGFHNWIQFYLEEAKGRVDYQGYIFPRRRGQNPDSESQLLTVQFEWNGVLKSLSSTLIGVSPEFEIALYTLCFYLGEEDNHIQLGPYPVNIKCYRMGRDKIGSVFPIAES
ncbi:hypothetical protein AAC387_Pa08g2010 [Persea americana]